ncbi:MAG TPA: hypothetical protein VKA48_10515, partial [Gammaproteobacteria bacterium]|nr:hypothetical protein [Gammaproteobacteria bacterium]
MDDKDFAVYQEFAERHQLQVEEVELTEEIPEGTTESGHVPGKVLLYHPDDRENALDVILAAPPGAEFPPPASVVLVGLS